MAVRAKPVWRLQSVLASSALGYQIRQWDYRLSNQIQRRRHRRQPRRFMRQGCARCFNPIALRCIRIEVYLLQHTMSASHSPQALVFSPQPIESSFIWRSRTVS